MTRAEREALRALVSEAQLRCMRRDALLHPGVPPARTRREHFNVGPGNLSYTTDGYRVVVTHRESGRRATAIIAQFGPVERRISDANLVAESALLTSLQKSERRGRLVVAEPVDDTPRPEHTCREPRPSMFPRWPE